MNKNTKIIALLSVLIVLVVGIIVGACVALSDKDDPVSDVTVAATDSGEVTVSSSATTTTQAQTTTAESSEATTLSGDIAQLIIGKWTDSAEMSGYEFFEDGTVKMTYVNLTVPIINLPVNGTSSGVYSLSGNTLTTKFSIYSATIENTYTVSVENNVLSMYNTEEKETSTYKRASAAQQNTQASSSEVIAYADEIIGTWVGGSDETYSFKQNNVLSVVSGGVAYSGVYLTDGTSIILQYSADGNKITKTYTFNVEKNVMTLTDASGDLTVFTRQGTSSNASASDNNSLIGKWTDGAKMSGYEFQSGGVVVVTYMNFTVPVINMPITGSYTGSYTISGDTLTLSYTIYGNSIVDTFEYEISNNVLTLISPDGDVSTYIKE